MNWYLTEIDIKGNKEFLEKLQGIIEEHNPNEDDWAHVTEILDELHINSKPFDDQLVFWARAKINKLGHLIVGQYYGTLSAKTNPMTAEVLKNAYPDMIHGINYHFIGWF